MSQGDLLARAVDIIHVETTDGLIGMNIATARCYGFNASAAEIWRVIDASATVEMICQKLAARFDTSAAACEPDVLEAVGLLEKEGLLKRVKAT